MFIYSKRYKFNSQSRPRSSFNLPILTPLLLTIFYVIQIITNSALAIDNNNDLNDLDLYKIVWKGQLTSLTEQYIGDSSNVINISTKNKERYKCLVPSDDGDQANFDSSAKNSSSTNSETGSDNDSANKSPIQVLEPLLKSNYCSYKYELFWVYELCHGKFLRQYHEESAKFKSKITQEYYLGKMSDDQLKAHSLDYEKQKEMNDNISRPTMLINGNYKPYISFNMTDGTKCDLTKNNRISKIIYVCNDEPKHILHSIKEISTCEYEAIVLSPLLCQHKDFKGETSTSHEILCYSLQGSPIKPTNLIEAEEEDEKLANEANKRKGIAYFQGRTLMIEADHIAFVN